MFLRSVCRKFKRVLELRVGRKREESMSHSLLGILASQAMISMRRGGIGTEQAKSSRYSEIGMILIPFTAVLWGMFLSGRPTRSQILLLGFFWVLCFAVFRNNFRYSMYLKTHRIRQDSLECVYRYYEHPGHTKCNIVYGEDLTTRLETARRLNISFYRAYLARRTGAR